MTVTEQSIFRQCSLEGLQRLLREVSKSREPKPMCQISDLIKAFGSRGQAYKYAKVAAGLRLVSIVKAGMEVGGERARWSRKFYRIEERGKQLLEWLDKYDDKEVVVRRELWKLTDEIMRKVHVETVTEERA